MTVGGVPAHQPRTGSPPQDTVSPTWPSPEEEPGRVLRSVNDFALAFPWVVFLFFLIILSLCYASALFTVYGFLDDYPFLAGALRGELFFGQVIAGGRPAYAVLLNLFFSCVRDIGDLRYGRLFGVVGMAWLATNFYRTLVGQRWSPVESVLVSLIIFTLPPFQVYAAWAIVAFYVYAALAAGGAFALLERALATPRVGARRSLALAALFLQLLALTIHQSAAMFFWVFAAVRLSKPELQFREALQRLSGYGLFMCISLLCGYGIHKLGVAFYGPAGLQQERLALTVDWGEKFVWFLRKPLMTALGGFWLFPPAAVSLSVALVIAAGLGLYFHGGVRERLRRGLLLLLLLPLSYLPNLAVAENWASYRTLPALAALLVVYGFFALQGYHCVLRRFFPWPFARVTLSGGALVAMCLAAYNVNARFATPQFRELEFVRAHLERADLSHVSGIFIIALLSHQWQGALASIVHYDEFDFPSSAREWGPPHMVFALLCEGKREYASLPITLAPPNDVIVPPTDALVIDMRDHFRALLTGR